MKLYRLTGFLCKNHLTINITVNGPSIIILLILKVINWWGWWVWGDFGWSELLIEHTTGSHD